MTEQNGPESPAGTARILHTGTYPSESLGGEQPYAWLSPDEGAQDNREAERRYPLLILLHGRDGSYADWPTRTRLARYAADYGLAIAFPDGGSGWYTDAFDGSADREEDIIGDFARHLQAALPVLPPGRSWGIGGLSMGGYGALKLALKHPEMFALAVSHSGALEKPQERLPHPVFGDPEAQAAFRRRESLFWLAEQALCRFPLARPRLVFDCGLSDELLEANRRFHDHLNFLGYHHAYAETPGYHTWPYWNRALRAALPDIARALGAERLTSIEGETATS